MTCWDILGLQARLPEPKSSLHLMLGTVSQEKEFKIRKKHHYLRPRAP
jgi:hypothetical protein